MEEKTELNETELETISGGWNYVNIEIPLGSAGNYSSSGSDYRGGEFCVSGVGSGGGAGGVGGAGGGNGASISNDPREDDV